MSSYTKEELENMLEDVVNVLDLSDGMIEKHGPMGTPPADLVKEVLDRKNLEISALRRGFNVLNINVLNINVMTEEEIIKASIVYMNNEIDATFDDNKNHEDDKVCSFREIEIAFKEGAKWALGNQWNDASKELPFPHEEVYVLDSEGFPDIGFHEQNGAWKTRGSLRLEKIKYWMPIPPAPRKENIK